MSYENSNGDMSDNSEDEWVEKKSRRYIPPKKTFHKTFKKEQKKENLKKVLCNNITHSGKCQYGSKCLYAHSLEEQNIEPMRKYVLELLDRQDLENVNINDDELYDTLYLFTRICNDCINGKCTGGYNCKHGICKRELQICYDDLNYGFCDDKYCKLIHLSKKGLHPKYKLKGKTKFGDVSKYNGALLTEDLLMKMFTKKEKNVSDDEVDRSIEDMIINDNYEESDPECEKSIFEDNLTKLFD
uniref:C3H1-type domain-containing protein n=1 Tax=viral metagenome TaxID=1070528 RepID=A0A6C0EAJ7_9ZZZZ